MSEQLKKALRRTNFDDLNEKGYTVVKSKQKFNPDTSSEMVKSKVSYNPDLSKTIVSGEKINPDVSKEIVKSKTPFNPDVSTKKVVGPKFNPDVSITKVSGGVKSLGKALKGTGKIAAIGAALGAVGNVIAGEAPDWKTMGQGAAEALVPAPVDAAFGSLANSELLTKEDLKQMREEKSRAGALEFGKRLAKSMKTGKSLY